MINVDGLPFAARGWTVGSDPDRHSGDTPQHCWWYRKLIAQKYDGSANRKPGRPMNQKDVTALVVRMAQENCDWGYRRLHGGQARARNRSTQKRLTAAAVAM